MPNWRDELVEVVKTKAEREAEEKERHKKRVEEALTSAEAAMQLALESLRFARDKLVEKGQPGDLSEHKDHGRLSIREVGLNVELVRESAVIKVTFIEGDLFTADISGATVVTLYLSTSVNRQLEVKLKRELRPGTRIVSHQFRIGDWPPERSVKAEGDGTELFLWTIPAR